MGQVQLVTSGDSPQLADPGFGVEEIVDDLDHPIAMAFLDNSSDILVAEKDDGEVLRVVDGDIQDDPVIDVAVANDNGTNERGLLGMAVLDVNSADSMENTTYVLLYFTESGGGEDGDDRHGVVSAGNRLYRYELARGENGDVVLENPKLLMDLPSRPGPRYNGGPVLATRENGGNDSAVTIYQIIGDLDRHETQAQNFEDGPPPDGTSGIMRVDLDGNPLPDAILGDNGALPYYYAYGIRNSFGMDIDPVTRKLWDTENGPEFADEINLVEPGFNSGWRDVQGPASEDNKDVDVEDIKLVDFDGRGNYSDPEFVWETPVGVTAIKFFNSSGFGEQYENDMFVGDINSGNLYHFELNESRTGLALEGTLADKVADSNDNLNSVLFGTGFDGITDIEVGPDGNLYVLSFEGKIYKIFPREGSDNLSGLGQ